MCKPSDDFERGVEDAKRARELFEQIQVDVFEGRWGDPSVKAITRPMLEIAKARSDEIFTTLDMPGTATLRIPSHPFM